MNRWTCFGLLLAGALYCGRNGACFAEAAKAGAASPSPAVAAPTYAGDLAPLIRQNCLPCHAKGGEGKYPLESYEDLEAHRARVIAVVEGERMPPFPGRPGMAAFTNAPKLSMADRGKFRAWDEGGRPRGTASEAKEPAPASAPAADLRLNLKGAVKIPAEGTMEPVQETLPYVVNDNLWVSGLRVSVKEAKLLDYAILLRVGPEGSVSMLAFLAPGMRELMLPEGISFVLGKGCQIKVALFFVTNGKERVEEPVIELIFPRKPVMHEAVCLSFNAADFTIPPQTPNFETAAETVIAEDSLLIGAGIFMRRHGSAAKLWAVLPGGSSVELLNIPQWDVDHQLTYLIEPGNVALPTGTEFHLSGTFDNSYGNPRSINPQEEVSSGGLVTQEGLVATVLYVNAGENLNIAVDTEKQKSALAPEVDVPAVTTK